VKLTGNESTDPLPTNRILENSISTLVRHSRENGNPPFCVPPSEIITPPSPSYLKREWQSRGRYLKGGVEERSGYPPARI